MRRVFLFTLLTFLTICASAQLNKYGVPTIVNYDTKTTQAYDYNWSIVEDKTHVLYFASETKGVARYDGSRWSLMPIRNEALVRCLCVADDGVIYAGGAEEFGYLQPEGNGTMKYISVSKRLEKRAGTNAGKKDSDQKAGAQNTIIGQIYSIISKDGLVYFQGQESLFIYDATKDSLKYINLRAFGIVQAVRLVNIKGRLILADNVTGLFELKDEKPVRLPGGEFFKMKMCVVIMPDKGNNLFIGTLEHGAFQLNPETGKVSTTVLEPSLNESLKSLQIYSSIDLNSGERLLGTIKGGIFILDENYKLIGRWNNNTTDMPDNSMLCFFQGREPSSELWFATNGNISKAYIGLPYTELSTRSGMEGGLNYVAFFNGNVYVTSDYGLFGSYINEEGERAFRSVPKINREAFPLFIGKHGDEKFLLTGTKLGLYQTFSNGRIDRVDDMIKYASESRRSIFAIRTILQSEKYPEVFYLGLESGGVVVVDYNGKDWKIERQIKSSIKGNVTTLLEDKEGNLFIFTGNPTGIYLSEGKDTIPVEFSTRDGLPSTTINSISKINGNIYTSTGKGIYLYKSTDHKWYPDNDLLKGYTKDLYCRDLNQDHDGDIWFTSQEERIREILFLKDSAGLTAFKGPLSLLPDIDKGDFKFFEDRYWITKSKSLFVIDKKKISMPKPEVRAIITKIVIGGDSVIMNNSFYQALPDGKNVVAEDNRSKPVPQIRFNYNSASFSWSLPYYVDEGSTVFSYKLDGFDKSWSKWEKLYYKDFTYLPFGKYTFRVKARTETGIESREAVFEFNILKPWYVTAGMIIVYVLVFVGLIIVIIKAYTRKLKNENIRLEGIVAERTAVVVKQKEELESSIHYARRIQMALLPSESILSENFKNYFILFKPRDIVSGDFYWMTKKDNRLYVVAADCTGHGVPGAFMSLLGMSFLDEIIDKDVAPRADRVLAELRQHVTESLKQSGGDDEAKDGMDMALLVIDFNVSKIEFSGAYNPCFRVRKLTGEEIRKDQDDNNEMPDGSMSNGKYLLETIYASKMPIGISSRMNENFVFYDWNLEKGVSYYMFSDGYIDQFGGDHGRKFMKKNFKKLILDIQDYPLSRQKELLDKNLKDWMGASPQIDDILVIGLRTE
ncbi:MAG TPA: SpoIIE family protein phosphatase [Bacteroidales bacterium]|nr:SpoIIE family protein phosphatase [Bacteroidales bacterium]